MKRLRLTSGTPDPAMVGNRNTVMKSVSDEMTIMQARNSSQLRPSCDAPSNNTSSCEAVGAHTVRQHSQSLEAAR